MSVSAEDREKAWAEWLAEYLAAMSKGSSDPVIVRMGAQRKAEEFYRPVFEAGFNAAGAGPVGVSARPDRTALVAALHAQLAPGHHPDWDLSVTTCSACEHIADALLAVEHLWTQPAGGGES